MLYAGLGIHLWRWSPGDTGYLTEQLQPDSPPVALLLIFIWWVTTISGLNSRMFVFLKLTIVIFFHLNPHQQPCIKSSNDIFFTFM